ncbi:MAG: N-acetylmuramoyl-L-alanine amidase [Akkermansiaceae bacterium]
MKEFRCVVFLVVSLFFGGLTASLEAANHLVQSGETFYRIAKNYGVSVDRLMTFNGYRDPSKLRAGSTIKIPGKDVRVAIKATRAQPKPVTRKSLRVIIDAGHGGKDRGAMWGGVHEADLNLKVAQRVESSLKKLGYPVTMTRRSDSFVSLARRAQIANRYSKAIFVSIHFNATRHTSVRGAETFFVGGRGGVLAKAIQERLVSTLKVRNRGSRCRKFSVLRQTSCPAVLVECGFISNSQERSRCRTAWYQATAAQAIVSGVQRYDRIY